MSTKEYVVVVATLCVVTETDLSLRRHRCGNSSCGISLPLPIQN